jgi:hypothetical protein
MTFDDLLKVVKQQNPGMPHKEAQKVASERWQRFKNGNEALSKGGSPSGPVAGPSTVQLNSGGSPIIAELAEAEKNIRKGPIDVNKVVTVGRPLIPDGQLMIHGKASNLVNSLVTFEDKFGNRFPQEGFFEIWL